jgi:hypothetical protein
MYAKNILIRAIASIESRGYITKDHAMVAEIQSTAEHVMATLHDIPDIDPNELKLYGEHADNILKWIATCPVGGNEYLLNCRDAVTAADVIPHKVAGYIVSLVGTYEKHLKTSRGLDRVTQLNAFAQDAGLHYSGTGEVINLEVEPSYVKLSIVDDDGYLVTFTETTRNKKGLIFPSIGDRISISGNVYRNKFTTPFETSLSRPTVVKI